MKIHSYFKPVLIILILILSITGCTENGGNSNTFDITGRIVDVMDKGIPQTTVKIKKDNGDTVVVKTDENGQFSKTGLRGEVEVTVAKEEYNFDNPTRTVSSSSHLKFKGKLEVKVSDKAQVLDVDIENKIVEVNENEVIFEGSDSMINNLTKGDIIISDPIVNIAPNGIFRKIEGKTASGSQIILTTLQATLKDVIEQGGFSQVKELKYEDVETQILNQANKKIQLQASPSPAHEFRVSINKEIEIADGVTISGSLDFNMNLKLEGTYKYFILQGVRFEEIITQKSGLNITYSKGIEIEKEKEIFEKTLPRVKFTIGPVPVWITPEFNLVLGVDGNVSAGLTTEVTAVKEITAGFEYEKDEGIQKIFEQTNDYTWEEPTLEGSSNIHGYLGPKMEFDFYEVTGPTTSLYPYLDFIGEVTTNISYLDMGWDLKGGLQGQIGAQIEFMGVDVEASYNLDLISKMIAKGVMLKTDTVGKGKVQKQPDQLLYYVPEWKGEDAEIKITALPDTGYRFDHWETGYNNIGSENPYNIKIDKPTLVTAIFEEASPENYTLTIDTSGEGTVTPSEGYHEYNEGAEVTLEANPADGWEFVEWQGDISDTSSTTTLTMNGDKNVTAVFEEKQNTIAKYNGKILINGESPGKSISLKIFNESISTINQISTDKNGNYMISNNENDFNIGDKIRIRVTSYENYTDDLILSKGLSANVQIKQFEVKEGEWVLPNLDLSAYNLELLSPEQEETIMSFPHEININSYDKSNINQVIYWLYFTDFQGNYLGDSKEVFYDSNYMFNGTLLNDEKLDQDAFWFLAAAYQEDNYIIEIDTFGTFVYLGNVKSNILKNNKINLFNDQPSKRENLF